MSDEDKRNAEAAVGEDAIDLDTDEEDDLDQAMREALEAIEHGADEGDRDGGEEGEEAAAPDVEGETPADPVEALRHQLAAERERSLRALADLENYRKRIERERREERRYRAFEPLREILTIIDNLERALASPGSVDDLKQGVELILRQMRDLLKSHGVERVEALGEDFDPSLHEAVSREEDPEVDAPTVAEEMQSGYTMHGRLLRPSVVKVAMPVQGAGATPEEVD